MLWSTTWDRPNPAIISNITTLSLKTKEIKYSKIGCKGMVGGKNNKIQTIKIDLTKVYELITTTLLLTSTNWVERSNEWPTRILQSYNIIQDPNDNQTTHMIQKVIDRPATSMKASILNVWQSRLKKGTSKRTLNREWLQ